MMQKVRGLISACLYLTGLFHFFFSVPLRYFFYSSNVPFLSPILGGKNGLFFRLSILRGINSFMLCGGWGLAVGYQSNSICTDIFSV